MVRSDVYQHVTDTIVAALERGTVPWHKPWTGGGPQNVRTRKLYRGINVFLLEIAAVANQYGDPRWGTYKAIKEAGGQVRRGEHGTWIIFWKRIQKKRTEEDEERDGTYMLARAYKVFNAEQADGVKPMPEGNEWEPIERAEEIVRGFVPNGPLIQYGGSSAYYDQDRDLVACPKLEQFESPESYYRAQYHELIHSTGHPDRLDRLERCGFGSGPYAKEELVAELGSSMLAGIAGLTWPDDDAPAAYIANWLQALQDDRKLVVQSAALAQRASDLILGETFDEEILTHENREAVAA
jgi:antirestriction protein ArdC